MRIITLTTDLGVKDYYVASLKGKIYGSCPDVKIVDITHYVSPFQIQKAAYLINGCYADFPDGTIHVIGVQSEPIIDINHPEKNRLPSILKFKNQYFISNDNGFFSLIVKEEIPQGFWKLDEAFSNPKTLKDATKYLLVEAAINLCQQVDISTFAIPSETYKKMIPVRAVLTENEINGEITHIDVFGNIVTNITQSDFNRFGIGTRFIIRIGRSDSQQIDHISGTYSDAEEGELVALFNLNGFLEIAINMGTSESGGGVSHMFRYFEKDKIRVVFYPKDSSNSIRDLFG